jgi:hypothetical protein
MIMQVRNGEEVENADILRFAQLFSDELNLENWERMQLVSICQVYRFKLGHDVDSFEGA